MIFDDFNVKIEYFRKLRIFRTQLWFCSPRIFSFFRRIFRSAVQQFWLEKIANFKANFLFTILIAKPVNVDMSTVDLKCKQNKKVNKNFDENFDFERFFENHFCFYNVDWLRSGPLLLQIVNKNTSEIQNFSSFNKNLQENPEN